MENGAFARKSKYSFSHNIFKYMIFQRRQMALLFGKGLHVIAAINAYLNF